jgi:hypothetical protein
MAKTERTLEYGEYDDQIPEDYLPAHNHVIHTPDFPHGLNGFRRFWIPPEWARSRKWSKCPCGWKDGGKKWNEKETHYALTEHAEWWKEEVAKRGSLKAVYRRVETETNMNLN